MFDGSLDTWVFTEAEKADAPNVRYVTIDFENDLIGNILNYLYQQRIQSVLIEGGRQLLQSFIDSNLWDEARVLESSHSLGGGIPAPVLSAACLKTKQQLGDNWVKIYTNLKT